MEWRVDFQIFLASRVDNLGVNELVQSSFGLIANCGLQWFTASMVAAYCVKLLLVFVLFLITVCIVGERVVVCWFESCYIEAGFYPVRAPDPDGSREGFPVS